MISVKKVWDLVEFITNKENEGNTVTPKNRNAILEAANIDVLKRRYGLPEEYQVGMPLPRMTFESTQKMIDDMHQFKYTMGLDGAAMIVDEWGKASIPSDYLHFIGAFTLEYEDTTCSSGTVKYRQLEHLTTAQVAERLGDSIKIPTTKHPIFVTNNTYFQLYPYTINRVQFSYLRLPETPVYAYTTTDDIEVYNEGDSVHFEYPEDMLNDVVAVVLSYVGVNMRDQEVSQYSEMKKQRGV